MLDHHFHIDSDMSLETTIKLMREWWAQGIEFEAHCTDIKKEGTQSMLNTWMMWMEEVAKHMSAHGCTMPLYIDSKGSHHGRRDFEQKDAHALFTSRFLGTDSEGRRKSWAKKKAPKGQVLADMGDKLHCMDCLVDWATDKGIRLTIPSDSEYMSLKKEAA